MNPGNDPDVAAESGQVFLSPNNMLLSKGELSHLILSADERFSHCRVHFQSDSLKHPEIDPYQIVFN